MSTAESAKHGGKSKKTWRTKSASGRDNRHRWQVRGDFSDRRFSRTSWRRGVFLSGSLLAVLLSLGLFAYLILFSPKLTPMLTMVANDYSWPYRPNSWAKEDLARLMSLNDRSLRIQSVGREQMRRPEWIADFSRQLQRLKSQHGPNQPLIIYVSMHGAVDAQGNACLVPPNSSPTDSATWIPIPELFSIIKQLEVDREHPIVMFLDCNKTLSNLDRGVIYNTFPTALSTAVNAAEIPNFFVLNSTAVGEQAETSEVLGGSIFGYALWEALSGKADHTSKSGNGDHHLQLGEIVEYITTRVETWTTRTRGLRQSPTVFPPKGDNFEVSWAIAEFKPEVIKDRSENQRRVAQAVDSIFDLWSELERIHLSDALRLEPYRTTRFIQELAWCEQAILSGDYYLGRVETKVAQLTGELGQIRSEVGVPSDPSGDAWTRKPGPTGHTVALAKYLGNQPAAADAIARLLDEFRKGDAETAFSELVNPASPKWDHFLEVRFLKILRTMRGNRLPELYAAMAQVIKTQTAIRNLVALRDLRLQMHIAKNVTALDKDRRILEDRLLVGEFDANQWTQLHRRALGIQAEIRELERHYETSDRAIFEVPFFARWLADPLRPPEAFRRHVEMVDATLSPAFQQSRLLSSALEKSNPVSKDSDLERIRSAAAKVDQSLNSLREAWQSEATLDGSESAWDIDQFVANRAVLQIPLLFSRDNQFNLSGAEQRQTLFEVTRKMRRHFEQATSVNADQSQRGRPPSPTVNFESLRSLLTTTQELVRNLVAASPSELNTKPVVEENRSVEYLEAYLRAQCEAHPKQIRDVIENARTRETNTETSLGEADRRARRMASFWRPESNLSPCNELLKFNGDRFLLHQWNGVLNDFLGGGTLIEPAFFQRASTSYSKYFKSSEANFVELKLLALEHELRLTDRVRAANEALALASSPNIRVDGNFFGPIELQLQPGDKTAVNALPPLLGQAFVEHGQDRRASAQVHSIRVNQASNDCEHTFQFPSEPMAFDEKSSKLRGVFQFRGHHVSTPIRLTNPKGPSAKLSVIPSGSAEVTVIDSDAKPVSVMIILDCSQSMNEPVKWEAAGQKLSRFDAAVMATERILDTLSRLPDARVGVMLYGHRVGWNTKDRTELLRNIKYINEIPDSLKPYEDVESIVSFGRFGKAELANVRKILKTVEPWGETPLYLSIRSALSEMRAKTRDRKQQIVVITDGLNKQLNPSPEKFVSLKNLLEEDFGKAVVNIVGFGIDPGKSRDAALEFNQITNATNGTYVAINEAGRLMETLSDYFSKREFTVTTGTKNENQLAGSPVRLSLTKTEDQPAAVSFLGYTKNLTIHPGDAYQLLVDEKNRRLKSVRYLTRSPTFSRLSNREGPSDLRVGVHRPSLREGTLEIEISIQDRNDLPTDRPLAYRIGVQPLQKDGEPASPSYLISGNSFLPGKPVPVVGVEFEQWPKNAVACKVIVDITFDEAAKGESTKFQHMRTRPDYGIVASSISRTQPQELLVVKKSSSPAFVFSDTTRMENVSSSIDAERDLVVDRFVFRQPVTETIMNTLEFDVCEPESDNWLTNKSAPVVMPIEVNTPLAPLPGPILIR